MGRAMISRMNLTESRALAARLASLLRQEQHAMADFLAALAEFDQRRGWLELGHSGLFPFLHRELGLSKAAAFFRMTAATLIQRFPEILEPLRDGRLCLTTMASLAKVLTPENRAEVLPRFFRRSKQEAAVIAAELCPVASPPSRTVVTTVPAPVASASQVGRAPSVGTDQVRPDEPGRPEGVSEAPSVAPALPAPVRPMAVEPLTASQVRLHLTVPPEFLEKLEAARLALSHSMPGASAVDVITAGLDLLLQRDAKRKGLVESPRPAPPEEQAEPGAAHVPAAVRREVWERDGGCCQWPVSLGRRLRLAPPAPARSPGDAGGRRAVDFTQRETALRTFTTGSPRASGWGTGSWTVTAATRGRGSWHTTPRTPAEGPVPSSLGP